MRQIQGHCGGSTWAGATRPCGLPRRLTPRSSLPPTHYRGQSQDRSWTGTST